MNEMLKCPNLCIKFYLMGNWLAPRSRGPAHPWKSAFRPILIRQVHFHTWIKTTRRELRVVHIPEPALLFFCFWTALLFFLFLTLNGIWALWAPGPRYRAAYRSKVTLESSLGLHLLQPSMERDKKMCQASIVAEPLDHAVLHAASTLAQCIGMDQDKVLMGAQTLFLGPSFPLFLSLFFFLSLLLHLDRNDVCSPALRLIPPHFRARIDFSRKKISFGVVTVTPPPLQGLHAWWHTCWPPWTVARANYTWLLGWFFGWKGNFIFSGFC